MSNLFLNETLVRESKCLFMLSISRVVQRNVSSKYFFFKSLNLLTPLRYNFESDKITFECDLTFHLYQFKIHLNLRTDYENELFYAKCQSYLIKRQNNFNHTYKMCVTNFELNERDGDESIRGHNGILAVISNEFYLLVMFLVLFLMGMYGLLFFGSKFCDRDNFKKENQNSYFRGIICRRKVNPCKSINSSIDIVNKELDTIKNLIDSNQLEKSKLDQVRKKLSELKLKI
jgi:hypothetical protein